MTLPELNAKISPSEFIGWVAFYDIMEKGVPAENPLVDKAIKKLRLKTGK